MESDFSTEIDSEVIDVEDMNNTDIKINPDFYMHQAILKAQEALANPNKDIGFAQYRQFIEHIQVIAESSGLIGTEYTQEIKTYMESEEYKKASTDIASVRLSDRKLKLILTRLFSKKIKTDPLRAFDKKVA